MIIFSFIWCGGGRAHRRGQAWCYPRFLKVGTPCTRTPGQAASGSHSTSPKLCSRPGNSILTAPWSLRLVALGFSASFTGQKGVEGRGDLRTGRTEEKMTATTWHQGKRKPTKQMNARKQWQSQGWICDCPGWEHLDVHRDHSG